MGISFPMYSKPPDMRPNPNSRWHKERSERNRFAVCRRAVWDPSVRSLAETVAATAESQAILEFLTRIR